jgi:hypothetical protein
MMGLKMDVRQNSQRTAGLTWFLFDVIDIHEFDIKMLV